jgi:hypothetical protein
MSDPIENALFSEFSVQPDGNNKIFGVDSKAVIITDTDPGGDPTGSNDYYLYMKSNVLHTRASNGDEIAYLATNDATTEFLGFWDAETNDPFLQANDPNATEGQFYVVNVPGTQSVPSGTSKEYFVGDKVGYNSSNVWQRFASQLPSSVIRAGEWEANQAWTFGDAGPTNRGYYYEVITEGTLEPNLSNISTWLVGDWVLSNGTAWTKVSNIGALQVENGSLTNLALPTQSNKIVDLRASPSGATAATITVDGTDQKVGINVDPTSSTTALQVSTLSALANQGDTGLDVKTYADKALSGTATPGLETVFAVEKDLQINLGTRQKIQVLKGVAVPVTDESGGTLPLTNVTNGWRQTIQFPNDSVWYIELTIISESDNNNLRSMSGSYRISVDGAGIVSSTSIREFGNRNQYSTNVNTNIFAFGMNQGGGAISSDFTCIVKCTQTLDITAGEPQFNP